MTNAPIEIDLSHIQSLPPEERRQELARIAAFKRQIELNPLWSYVPHKGDEGKTTWGQLGFHEIDTWMGAFVAGNRGGKTHAGAVDMLIQILPEVWLPPWLRAFKRWDVPGDFHGRVVGVDLPNWLEKVMIPKLRSLIPPGALHKGEFDKAYNERKRMLTFADGSWIDFLTHDMAIDAYAGASMHLIWMDEEPPGELGRQQFDESITRLTDTNGDIRFTLTPLLGLSWVFNELTDSNGQPRRDEEVTVVTGDMDHNPHTSTEAKERLKKRWAAKDPLTLAARTKGQWIHFAGLIYDEYRDAPPIVVGDRPIPRKEEGAKPTVPIYAAIDPGINHPAGLVFAWIDEEDVMEVFWAQKYSDLTVTQHADIYWSVLAKFDFKPRWTVIDPAAQNRNPQTGRNLQWAYQERGIHTMLGQNAREAGFNEIKSRLRTERLRIHAENCKPLREEFLKYRWKPQRGKSEDAAKPEPIKIFDDLLDPLRYLAMSLPQKADVPREEDMMDPKQRLVREHLAGLGRRKKRRIGSTR